MCSYVKQESVVCRCKSFRLTKRLLAMDGNTTDLVVKDDNENSCLHWVDIVLMVLIKVWINWEKFKCFK